MSQTDGLSLDQAPPIQVPMRFFLTAPLFALAAAILLLWQGPSLLASRWTPAMLGATHLLTLGHMALTMMGAMLQMLPVVAGSPVRRPVFFAAVIHLLATSGVLLLSAGLVFSWPSALRLALPVLGFAIFPFAAMVLYTLHRARPENMTARAMRLAVWMLAATAVLGMTMLSNHAYGWWLHDRETMTNLHLTWGLLGWVGILASGVAYQVVPMFQLTPSYPPTITRWLAPTLFALLLAFAPAAFMPSLRLPLGLLAAAGFAAFALTTLWLQTKRRRKLSDVTLDFWRGGTISLLLAIALWLTAQLFPAAGLMENYGLLLGILTVMGFSMSLINGMLYKIVPFLVWFHLQSKRGPGGPTVPNVKLILPEKRARRQMWLHFAALAALLAAAFFPHLFARPAALLLGASNIWLWLNIAAAGRTYRTVNAALEKAKISAG